jgi:hypothetical protein
MSEAEAEADQSRSEWNREVCSLHSTVCTCYISRPARPVQSTDQRDRSSATCGHLHVVTHQALGLWASRRHASMHLSFRLNTS